MWKTFCSLDLSIYSKPGEEKEGERLGVEGSKMKRPPILFTPPLTWSQLNQSVLLSSGGGSDTVHGARVDRHVDSAHATRRRLRRQQSGAAPDRAGDGLEVLRHHRLGAGLRGAGGGGCSRLGHKQLSSHSKPNWRLHITDWEGASARSGRYNKIYIYQSVIFQVRRNTTLWFARGYLFFLLFFLFPSKGLWDTFVGGLTTKRETMQQRTPISL